MTVSRQVEVFAWLAGLGAPVSTPGWFMEADERYRPRKGVVHASKVCPRSRTPFEGQGYVMGFEEAAEHYDFCASCLPVVLDPSAQPGDAAELLRRIHVLHQVSARIAQAGSTFHVMCASAYPELHAALVDDVARDLRVALAVPSTHSLLALVRDAVTAELDALVAAHPYDAAKASQEAVLMAARWRFDRFVQNDLFRRGLKEHRDPVRDLGNVLAGAVTRPGEAFAVASRLLAENADLASSCPSLGEVLSAWAGVLDAALLDVSPTYFAFGGLPLELKSVPRTPFHWMIRQGVRACHHHWGLGELPRVVLELLKDVCGNPDMKMSVEIIDVPYEELSEEAWLTADALWREHQNSRRSEILYAHPGEAIIAAARL